MSICVFGDSTAWGAWDEEKGGWVNRLRLSLEYKNYEPQVYNLAIDGDTSEGVRERFEAEAALREAGIVIIAIGANDSGTDEGGNFFISAAQFEDNLRALANTANKLGYVMVFLDFENIDESKTNPVSWANVYYSEEDLDKYSAIMKTVAEESNIYFCSIRGLLTNEDLADGLHPNESGHAKIAETVEKYLINNKIVSI